MSDSGFQTCYSTGWRPGFKFYNKWVALFGAAICVAIMFIIRWYYALVTFIIVLILYKIVDFLKPGKLLSYDAVSLWCERDIQKIKKESKRERKVGVREGERGIYWLVDKRERRKREGGREVERRIYLCIIIGRHQLGLQHSGVLVQLLNA